MFENEYIKTCPSCEEAFEAQRSNQVYCTQHCKSRYHNGFARQERRDAAARKEVTQDIDNIMWTNRQVLAQYRGTKQKLEDLREEGFNSNYMTHFEQLENKQNIFVVYDVRYMFLKEDLIRIE